MQFHLHAHDRAEARRVAYLASSRDLTLRCRAVLAIASGLSVAAVARACRVSRPTVYEWCRVAEAGGVPALEAMRPIPAGLGRPLYKADRINFRSVSLEDPRGPGTDAGP